jgi:hypothetical protein
MYTTYFKVTMNTVYATHVNGIRNDLDYTMQQNAEYSNENHVFWV